MRLGDWPTKSGKSSGPCIIPMGIPTRAGDLSNLFLWLLLQPLPLSPSIIMGSSRSHKRNQRRIRQRALGRRPEPPPGDEPATPTNALKRPHSAAFTVSPDVPVASIELPPLAVSHESRPHSPHKKRKKERRANSKGQSPTTKPSFEQYCEPGKKWKKA